MRKGKNDNVEVSMVTKDQNRKMLVKFMRVFLFRDVIIYQQARWHRLALDVGQAASE